MITLKLTSKRQATLPKETCEALGLKPGDTLELEARDGEAGREWILRPLAMPARPWVGSLAKFSEKTPDHSMDAVRESIARGRAAGEP